MIWLASGGNEYKKRLGHDDMAKGMLMVAGGVPDFGAVFSPFPPNFLLVCLWAQHAVHWFLYISSFERSFSRI